MYKILNDKDLAVIFFVLAWVFTLQWMLKYD